MKLKFEKAFSLPLYFSSFFSRLSTSTAATAADPPDVIKREDESAEFNLRSSLFFRSAIYMSHRTRDLRPRGREVSTPRGLRGVREDLRRHADYLGPNGSSPDLENF